MIRRTRDDELPTVLAIINEAAQAYRGVIPEDCWHEPYMSGEELQREMAAGVAFWGFEAEGGLAGVMGLQEVEDVTLIRHAYVRPRCQGRGVGGRLLGHLVAQTDRRVLIGTWAAATWAIRFYERHGFRLVPAEEGRRLLGRYWSIPARQLAASVVLAGPGAGPG